MGLGKKDCFYFFLQDEPKGQELLKEESVNSLAQEGSGNGGGS